MSITWDVVSLGNNGRCQGRRRGREDEARFCSVRCHHERLLRLQLVLGDRDRDLPGGQVVDRLLVRGRGGGGDGGWCGGGGGGNDDDTRAQLVLLV